MQAHAGDVVNLCTPQGAQEIARMAADAVQALGI